MSAVPLATALARKPAPGRFPTDALEEFVVGGPATEHDVPLLVSSGLASVARRRLARGAAGVAAERRIEQGVMQARARHTATRATVLPLLRSWRAAGVDVLVFKGFLLAERVYQDPADRPYADVDVAVRAAGVEDEALAERVAELAEAGGWVVRWRLGAETAASRLDGAYDGHEIVQLRHPRLAVSVDVHRRLVHNVANKSWAPRSAERITRSAWEAAVPVAIGDAEVLAPSHVDSALIGLILSRSWSDDRHALNPHDYLDLEALMRAGGFGAEELLARARDLGVSATARSFLRRCDPARGVLDLGVPSAWKRTWLDARMSAERTPFAVVWALDLLRRAPFEVAATARAFPAAYAAVRRWRAGQVPEPGAGRLVADGAGVLPDRRTWLASTLGVRRSLRLVGLRSEDHPALALGALADAARFARLDVVVGREDDRVWFESGGSRLPLRALGAPSGARRKVWPLRHTRPRPSVVQRLRRMGWSGLRLRLEALASLRSVQRRLALATFAEVQGELAEKRTRVGQVASSGETGERDGRVALLGPSAAEIGHAVEAVTRFVPGAMCVAQSLAAQSMLRRRGLDSRIHVGFRRPPEGGVMGHAWLEVEGEVVTGDQGLDEFTRTAVFEG